MSSGGKSVETWWLMKSGRHHLSRRVCFEKISVEDQVEIFRLRTQFWEFRAVRRRCIHRQGSSARNEPKTSRYLGIWGPF